MLFLYYICMCIYNICLLQACPHFTVLLPLEEQSVPKFTEKCTGYIIADSVIPSSLFAHFPSFSVYQPMQMRQQWVMSRGNSTKGACRAEAIYVTIKSNLCSTPCLVQLCVSVHVQVTIWREIFLYYGKHASIHTICRAWELQWLHCIKMHITMQVCVWSQSEGILALVRVPLHGSSVCVLLISRIDCILRSFILLLITSHLLVCRWDQDNLLAYVFCS